MEEIDCFQRKIIENEGTEVCGNILEWISKQGQTVCKTAIERDRSDRQTEKKAKKQRNKETENQRNRKKTEKQPDRNQTNRKAAKQTNKKGQISRQII